MPIKLLGLGFLLAAWLIRRDVRRAQARGHIGPIRRSERRWRWRAAIAGRIVGGGICLLAAYLCLAGPRADF